MRVLFFMTHPGHLRNFESALRELARRGHRVHTAFDREKEGLSGQRSLVTGLDAAHDELTFGAAPTAESHEEWTLVAWQFRAMLDYLRYLEPPFADASRLRERAARQVPKALTRPLGALGGHARVKSMLRALERSVPPRESVLRFVSRHEPDLVLATPLLDLGSPQLDYLRAAQSLGIPTGLCVASWDNLTNKGLLHDVPTVVTVWNEGQRREAVGLHGVPPERVVATGAQAYDHWFGRRPSRASDELIELAGLPPGRPFVLYVASSRFLVPDEPEWIERWARAARAGGIEAGILVRPHPLSPLGAAGLERLAAIEGVAVWPPSGQNPVDDATRADYFDSLAHAAAVVGLNTSAMIEAAIAGRPVLTVVRPESEAGQLGTLHFHYLLAEKGGPAAAATSLEQHVEQLAAVLHGDAGPPATSFLRRFVRPDGLDQPAAPHLVDALEQAASQPAHRPDPPPLPARAARPLLALGGALGLRIRRSASRRDGPAESLSSVR
jgi:hypothetical protein